MPSIASTPEDVVLGEAGGKTTKDRYADMLAIASAAVNRARMTGTTLSEVMSLKSQFNAYGKALPAGAEKYRGLARSAINEVLTKGPVHDAIFYATPAAVKNLPKGLSYVTSTTKGHQYYKDPMNRSIATTRGYITPRSSPIASLPTTAPIPQAAPATIAASPASRIAGPGAITARLQSAPVSAWSSPGVPAASVASTPGVTRGLSVAQIVRSAAANPNYSPAALTQARAEMAAARKASEPAPSMLARAMDAFKAAPMTSPDVMAFAASQPQYSPAAIANARMAMAQSKPAAMVAARSEPAMARSAVPGNVRAGYDQMARSMTQAGIRGLSDMPNIATMQGPTIDAPTMAQAKTAAPTIGEPVTATPTRGNVTVTNSSGALRGGPSGVPGRGLGGLLGDVLGPDLARGVFGKQSGNIGNADLGNLGLGKIGQAISGMFGPTPTPDRFGYGSGMGAIGGVMSGSAPAGATAYSRSDPNVSYTSLGNGWYSKENSKYGTQEYGLGNQSAGVANPNGGIGGFFGGIAEALGLGGSASGKGDKGGKGGKGK